MSNLIWFRAQARHINRIESAIKDSSLGGISSEQLQAGSIQVVVQGTAGLEEDLSRGRVEGAIPMEEIASWFARFLKENEHGLVALADVIHSPNDSAVIERQRPGWWLSHGVVWPLFAGETVNDAEKALNLLRGGPQFFGFYKLPVTWTLPQDGAALSRNDLDVLRSSLVAAMIDVYDWDGLILWKRDVCDLFLPSSENGPKIGNGPGF